jgi:hypothetical protein
MTAGVVQAGRNEVMDALLAHVAERHRRGRAPDWIFSISGSFPLGVHSGELVLEGLEGSLNREVVVGKAGFPSERGAARV